MKKHLAFTLAEVLIALTIIGVIAALTVPTLITNVDNQQSMTKLKKAYATLGQVSAIEMADSGADCANFPSYKSGDIDMNEGIMSMLAKNVSGTPIDANTWKSVDGVIYSVDADADSQCTVHNIAGTTKVCGWVKITTKGNAVGTAAIGLDSNMNLTSGNVFEVPYYKDGVFYGTDLTDISATGNDDKNAAARVLFGTLGKTGVHPTGNGS